MDKKRLSKQHEDFVANVYGGIRSRSSGASDVDKGDVRSKTTTSIFECKMTGEPGRPKSSTLLKVMEKMADEAWAEEKEPVVCLRLFNPESPLASREGWVDLSVRLTSDDAVRERLYGHWSENGD